MSYEAEQAKGFSYRDLREAFDRVVEVHLRPRTTPKFIDGEPPKPGYLLEEAYAKFRDVATSLFERGFIASLEGLVDVSDLREMGRERVGKLLVNLDAVLLHSEDKSELLTETA